MVDRYAFLNVRDKEWTEIVEKIEETEKRWGAPFYLFNEKMIIRNIERLRECLGGDVSIAYSMKANPWLASAAAVTADYIEACTEGELELCRTYGISGKKIVLDGVLRRDGTVEKALAMGVKRFCIDSAVQAKQLAELCKEREVEILLRLSSGNRFGMDEDEVKYCIHICRDSAAVRIAGVQYYPGTQRGETGRITRELERLEQWMKWLESFPGLSISELQFGSGIGFPYFTCDEKETYTETVDAVAGFVKNFQKRYRVIYEAGRCISAAAGIYVTKVFQTKLRKDGKIAFCLGGTNHLQYPGGMLGIREPYIESVCSIPLGREKKCMVCGSLCNEADILLYGGMLDEGLQEGDILIFYGAGAYSATGTPNLFLTMEMPSVLVYNETSSVYSQNIRCVRGHTSTYRILDDRM